MSINTGQEFSIASEYKRKAVHIGSLGFAFLLRYLNFWQGAILAVLAFLFNSFVLPKIGGKKIYRDQDVKRGYPIGILLYPISVLMLILFFPTRLHIAGAAWAIMALGDGFASIFGKQFGTTKLPWNQNRSYAGTLAFIVFGSLGAILLTLWIWQKPPQPHTWYLYAIPVIATLVAAIVETIPSGIDDNLTVPLSAGFVMLALQHIDPSVAGLKQNEIMTNLAWGALINFGLAAVSYTMRMVTWSGFLSGFLIGTILYTFGGYEFFLILLAFFVLGSGATKFGYAQKKARGIAQEKGGARGWKNAVANCTTGAFLAIMYMLGPEHLRMLFAAGFFGAFATAAADTVSSEIGQVLGKHPILITTLRPVPVGTEGAVSIEGTVAGIVASIVIAAIGILLGVLNLPAAAFVVIAAFIGTTVESYLGATLETMKVIDNEIINFMNTVVGAVAAMLLVAAFS